MDPITPFLINPAIEILKRILAGARKRFGKRKANQLVSAVISELLKESPDFTAAEARLAAAKATGVEPDMNVLRAESMLDAARTHAKARRRSQGFKAKFKKQKRRRKRK